MKENEDKYITQVADKMMKETSLESPSHDFTAKVMSGVWAIDKSKATVYKPLISTKGWVLIFGGIIATVIYFFINVGTQSEDQAWSLGIEGKGFLKGVSSIHLFQASALTINIILLATILIFIQITLLKNHLDKRLQK